MGMNTARISMKDVTLEYPIYNVSGVSIRHKILNAATGGYIARDAKDVTVIRALSNINLEVLPGDRLGIMGHNGSGKTTLLRCISGIYQPTSGNIDREGSLSILIEIGAGLEPDLSGFDNIRRLLLLRGFNSSSDMPCTIKQIGDFSELGDFLSLPVRTYSSGMMMRLMFAVATVETPDILVMDEFFSVGDGRFREKADKHLKESIEKTSILVFASHNEDLIKSMCNRFFRMSHGTLEEVNL